MIAGIILAHPAFESTTPVGRANSGRTIRAGPPNLRPSLRPNTAVSLQAVALAGGGLAGGGLARGGLAAARIGVRVRAGGGTPLGVPTAAHP
jgi:hypothetical protein